MVQTQLLVHGQIFINTCMDKYRAMIEALYDQYDKVEGMSEEEACEYMGTSTKAEGLREILSYIRYYRKR